MGAGTQLMTDEFIFFFSFLEPSFLEPSFFLKRMKCTVYHKKKKKEKRIGISLQKGQSTKPPATGGLAETNS